MVFKVQIRSPWAACPLCLRLEGGAIRRGASLGGGGGQDPGAALSGAGAGRALQGVAPLVAGVSSQGEGASSREGAGRGAGNPGAGVSSRAGAGRGGGSRQGEAGGGPRMKRSPEEGVAAGMGAAGCPLGPLGLAGPHLPHLGGPSMTGGRDVACCRGHPAPPGPESPWSAPDSWPSSWVWESPSRPWDRTCPT